jgi:AraC family transcriptional regulator
MGMGPSLRVPMDRGALELHRLELDQFRISSARFPADLYLDSHYHDRSCLAVFLQGGFRERLNHQVAECTAGTVLLQPPQERHSDHFLATGCRVVAIEPRDLETESLEQVRELFLRVSTHTSPMAFSLAARIAQEMARPDAVTAIAVEGTVLELMAVLLRGRFADERRVPPWLLRARDRLHADSCAEHSVASLAREAGVHPAYLARQFRRCFGSSVGDYLRRVRIEWAARQIAESDEPLAAIAQHARFADQSHFTRAFRRYFGRPPGQFRRGR